MISSPLILLGSNRKHSDTQRLVNTVFEGNEHKIIDLLDYSIAQYNYEERYESGDGFLPIVDELLKHRVIVIATPIYWYAMSGYMKIFFDRLTDLTGSQKALGRQLKGNTCLLYPLEWTLNCPKALKCPSAARLTIWTCATAAYFIGRPAAWKTQSKSGMHRQHL